MSELALKARSSIVSFGLETIAAWALAILWISPLLYAFWAAFHGSEYAIHFDLFAPLTLDNFKEALSQAPFIRYGINTFILVTMLLLSQLFVCTLAAYAFARFNFAGSHIAFALVLVQLMIAPEILIVENYSTLAKLGFIDYRHRVTLHGQCVWDFSASPSLQIDPKRVGRGGAARGVWLIWDSMAGLCAARPADLSRLWTGVDQSPLE